MPKIESEISKSNLKIIEASKNQEKNETTCNCRVKTSCPVEGKYLSRSVIYKATVTHNNKEFHYIGSTARDFKIRYNEHIHSFRNKNLRESTKLSSFIQAAKFSKEMTKKNVKWKIIHKINQRKPSKICSLCNVERLEIAFSDKKSSLNSRTELIGKCRHFAKFYLKL